MFTLILSGFIGFLLGFAIASILHIGKTADYEAEIMFLLETIKRLRDEIESKEKWIYNDGSHGGNA